MRVVETLLILLLVIFGLVKLFEVRFDYTEDKGLVMFYTMGVERKYVIIFKFKQ